MSDRLPIKRALLSVSDKTGLIDLARSLGDAGVEIISTGGTARALKEAGIDVTDVEDVTGFPEIMDGRVKTLHPKIHGGLLAVRDDPDHQEAMNAHNIGGIDLLVANLYPFAETLAGGKDYATCVENVDIGGPAMIRAAAKNHQYVAVVTNPEDYAEMTEELAAHDGRLSYDTRQKLAQRAFALTAHYDAMISQWLHSETSAPESFPPHISFAGQLHSELRYGENPHQKAALYTSSSDTRPGVATATQHQGKPLSYNNLNDTNAAFELVANFQDPVVAIIKHANPCGVASAEDLAAAYDLALRCDPVSAFGGIIAVNRPLTADLARRIVSRFVEVVIAPEIMPEALDVFARKDKVRILSTGGLPDAGAGPRTVTPVAGGMLVQDADTGHIGKDDLNIVTDRAPTPQELADMLFAFTVAKHVKSNAIIYAKDLATVGIGAGQMSRLDSARIAAWKATEAAKEAGLDDSLAIGSVVASDAFFPFADGLIAAAEAGVTAVIQPGGSIRDEEVIEAANERGLAMALTGQRHFRH